MENADELRLDEVFGLLTDSRRRYVLYHLTEDFGTATVEELATEIATLERDRTRPNSRGNVERIETALRHTHLPKLADAGVITLGPNGQYVELDETHGLNKFLEKAARIEASPRITDDD